MNKPNPADIPIIFCSACNKAPMIAKTISQHLREKDGVDIVFACPRCGATMTEKLPVLLSGVGLDAGAAEMMTSTSGLGRKPDVSACRAA